MRIQINVPDGRIGKWEIRTFTVSFSDAVKHNLREFGRLQRYIAHNVPYKALYRHESDGSITTIMSNTPAEVTDHMDFIRKAKGDVLIFGLGIGMVVQALHDKSEIQSITIVEIDHDLIEYVGAYYLSISPKVRLIQDDALTYYNNDKYDAIWFDIWDIIDDQNLEQMKMLKKRWLRNSPLRMCWAEKKCMVLNKIG